MEKQFWLKKWELNDIAFHEREFNPLLVKHFGALSLKDSGRVFLPLCGKTLDITWLLSQGCHVVGVDLSERAVEQLFEQLTLDPTVSVVGRLKHYSASNIDIFVGDIFDVSGELLRPIDAIYDRAALVALPDAMRKRYASHLLEITERAPQLLLCFEYDQALMAGPPFSIDGEEINRLYSDDYKTTLESLTPLRGGLKGRCPADESVWLLQSL